MSGFSIRNPYLIVVLCLVFMILGTVSVSDMPVDMFPPINLTGGCRGYVLFRHAATAD